MSKTSKTLVRLALLLFFAAGCRSHDAEEPVVAPADSEQTLDDSDYDRYGFASSSYDAEVATVRRNETLSDILHARGLDHETIATIAERSRGIFDVRRIRPGNRYRVYTSDSTGSPSFLVYESSETKYAVIDLSGETGVRVEQRPIRSETTSVSGEIALSLYDTLEELGVDQRLALELAEIFAWQIDFYRVQRGDRFRVVFDQLFVGEKAVGIGRVHAARFISDGRRFDAFHLPDQGSNAYFDENGNSLRKTFLASPVRFSRISSRYSGRRFHPVLKRYRSHLGTDYAAPHGTPIRATGDGVVVEAAYKGYNGRYVKIRHNGIYTTAYLHMSRIESGIRPGAVVRQGDIIGYVGSTGLANGPHVCYRFWKHGGQVDPLREEFPSAEPVREDLRPKFLAIRDVYLSDLSALQEGPSLLPAYALLLK